jgi:hypothetical protein
VHPPSRDGHDGHDDGFMIRLAELDD